MREHEQQIQAQRRRNQSRREARFALTTIQAIRVRRQVYRQQRYIEIRKDKNPRDVSPEFYQANEATTHRLLPWLRREIVVLFGCRIPQMQTFVEQLLHDIISRIREHGIQSQNFYQFVQSHFLQYTDHFIHEFVGFASSKYNTVEHYDSHARYYSRNDSTGMYTQ